MNEDKEITKYNKITIGFVTQEFVQQNDKFVCIKQTFIAGDLTGREDDDGEPVEIDIAQEIYQAFDMQQRQESREKETEQQSTKDDANSDPAILITISGGAVQSVTKPGEISLEIRDYDVENVNAEDDPRCKQDEEGDWYQRMFWDETEIGE